MRRRFFLITFSVLLSAVASVSFIYFHFFQSEMLRLLDKQIERSSSLLYASDLSTAQLEDIEEADDIIADTLGEERINQIIFVYNHQDRIVYKNKDADLLSDPIPRVDGFQTVVHGKHSFRFLTLSLPQKTRVLQIGLLMDPSLLHWKQLSTQVYVYIGISTVLVFILALLLSTVLLRPLTSLAGYLNHVTRSLEQNRLTTVNLPSSLAKMSEKKRADEFGRLTVAVQRLVERMRTNFRATQTWMAQMTHELKTPLTIIRNDIDVALRTPEQMRKRLVEAQQEVDHMGQVMNAFLDWASVENAPDAQLELHAISLPAFVQQLVEKLNRVHNNRIQLEVLEQLTVFCKPVHLEQLISNLLVNALKYSPQHSTVRLKVTSTGLEVCDEGGGIPQHVLNRLGQPFNISKDEKENSGTGLGLAWIATICRKYGWKLQIQRQSTHTIVSVQIGEPVSR